MRYCIPSVHTVSLITLSAWVISLASCQGRRPEAENTPVAESQLATRGSGSGMVSESDIRYTLEMLPLANAFRSDYEYAIQMQRDLVDNTSGYVFSSSSGGTSVYMKVNDGQTFGAMLVKNGATDLTGEIFSFNLGRLLGFGDIVGPKIHCTMGKAGVQEFAKLVNTLKSKNKHKKENIAMQKKLLATNPSFIPGAYAAWGDKPIDWDELVNYRLGINGKVRPGNPFAKFLKNNGPMPRDRTLKTKIAGGRRDVNERQIAIDLSNMMVLDALNGQWDRYSGGNLQVRKHGSLYRIAVLDNGGTSNSLHSKYWGYTKSWVSRFDRETALRLEKISDFLKGRTGSLEIEGITFKSKEELKRALGVYGPSKARWERKFRGFERAIGTVVSYIRSVPESSRYFD